MTDMESLAGMARYALYYCPPEGSALYRFGARWLGRDPATGAPLPLPSGVTLSREEVDGLTAEPRRYGFHATLKAPFALAAGATVAELVVALEYSTGGRRPFEAPPLVLAEIDDFLALVPSAPSSWLEDFAAACVVDFERFRAPLSPEDQARRQSARLTARQAELLKLWGYPFLLDEFRFHMTLTGRLSAEQLEHVGSILRPLTARFAAEPLTIDGIALFGQRTRQEPFHLLRRFPFTAGAALHAAGGRA